MVGMGIKKSSKKEQKRQWTVNKHVGITTKQELEFSPINRPISIRFINKALSNYDFINWIDQLKIKHFRSVFSRDNLAKKIQTLETGIINLDDSIGPGSHWVCYRNIDKNYCEYSIRSV